MNYYLVDFENVKTDGIKDLKGLKEGDELIIFYSETCKNITLDVLDSFFKLNVKCRSFKVNVGTKNALDFQLASYLGYLIGQHKSSTGYHIVSNDKGFEVVAKFWKDQKYNVKCVSITQAATKSEPKKATPKKKSKVSANDKATIEEIKTLIDKNDQPEEVLKIFNQYKTKQAISNGLAKHFKDSKKSSEIYKKLKPLIKAKNKS